MPKTSATEGLLTTTQVAERLGASVRTVSHWAKAGHLPVAHKLPGRTGAMLFNPADVDRFQASKLERVTLVRLRDEAAS